MREFWHAAKIELERDGVDLASHLLFEAGCNGIVEEAQPAGEVAVLTAYFSAEGEEASALSSRIISAFAPHPLLAAARMEIVTSEANEWRDSWRQWFKPFAIVPGVVVSPSWEDYKPKEDEMVITLDPGMAFGTGLHQTTQLCAQAIFDACSSASTPASLLDVGTGSGLLAMVAHKLGVRRIFVVENDPDALAVAGENFELNGVRGIGEANQLSTEGATFDLVVANILLLTLIELRDSLVERTALGGLLVLSGITEDQEQKILETFSPVLKLISTTRKDEWSCMTFLRPK